jgi:4-aminobutyrate aminotransferase-like enzyme
MDVHEMLEQAEAAAVFTHPAFWVEVDLSPASDFFDDRDWADAEDVAAGVGVLLGDRTDSAGFTRHLSRSMLFAGQRSAGAEQPETVQVGMQLLTREGSLVRSLFDGVVVKVSAHGPVVVEHVAQPPDAVPPFWTCWRGIQPSVMRGDAVRAGAELGRVAPPAEDRGTGPYVHVQVLTSPEAAADPPPERVAAGDTSRWAGVTADPAPLLSIPGYVTAPQREARSVMRRRDRRLARSQRAYYRTPPHLVRGRGVWMYDEDGFAYLDAINNVTHVGHAEPRISAAATRQMKKLNTNSRFLYEGMAAYAERLVETLPAPLEVVFFVCTGSEANDLALRMSRQVTGRDDVMVIDGAYHGNTTAVMGISPNRYKGPGGRGAPATTHEVLKPDTYRGPYGSSEAGAYAEDVARVARGLTGSGRPPAAFIAESLMGTAGNIVFPEGYLTSAFAAVRAEGGLCISDEVQVGLGRLGSRFWGFQVQDVVPDIVTMGKPLGNGHPIAAVITTREIADAFDDGVKYFNTFGGNPVSCAIGTTVLDIVQGDGLQESARRVGAYFLNSLEKLKGEHRLIGDVRGQGLYMGIDLVRDRDTKEPADREALDTSEDMKDLGVIVYPTGTHENVLKIKPPMVFDTGHVDLFVERLDRVLRRRAG